MAKKDNIKNDIEVVVLNYFIRTVKDDGKYMMFRNLVKNDGIMCYLTNREKYKYFDNPFNESSTINEAAKVLTNITDSMARSNGKKNGINGLDKYERVTMSINHLLHFFLESNGISMDKLCKLGEKIYALSCNKLFGDSLDDFEEDALESNFPDDVVKTFYLDFIKSIENGKLDKNTSFDEFLKAHMSATNRTHNDNATGHPLQQNFADNASVNNNVDWSNLLFDLDTNT